MATVWEAAEALLRMTGDDSAALAAATDLALLCHQSEEFAETEYWHSVADAVAWLSNSQPLIAPESPSVRKVRKLPRHASSQSLELPKRRSKVLRFRKQLRELWEQSTSERPPMDKPEDDSS